jgi:catechol 2,3-dioxygenase-like lactoylglutathione lyase family enzyme
MTTTKTKPRVTSLAPQFLVDDLARSITFYQKLGFTFGEPWDGVTRLVSWTGWSST